MRVIRKTNATILTKSSTYERHIGNSRPWNPFTWKFIQRFEKDGLLNAYGLTNDGVEVNARAIAAACRAGYNVIPNFYSQFAKGQTLAIAETLKAITVYLHHLGHYFWALELNFSCPNAKEEIRKNMEDALACVAAIRFRYPHLCLIGKISVVHPHKFAQELIDAGVNVIHAVNSVPYKMVPPDGPPSPLAAAGGGDVSGGPAFDRAARYNSVLRRRITAPIIMGCGVMHTYDADVYRSIGANAVSICSVVRLKPREAVKIVKRSAAQKRRAH